ncbi:PE family protein [Actinokineospora sp.]|uniref:PE family protein n=1 Tax=Actinokineospora sp. TaxID=1872133 RepID=UPI00403819D8
MPFLQNTGPIDATQPGGAIGSALSGMSTMRVDPDNIVELAHDLASVRDDVLHFLMYEGDLMRVLPPGADPVSRDGAEGFTENADQAVTAAHGYVEEMTRVIDSLRETSRSYGLVEESNTDAFLRQAGQ